MEETVHDFGVVRHVEVIEFGKLDLELSILEVALDKSSMSWH